MIICLIIRPMPNILLAKDANDTNDNLPDYLINIKFCSTEHRTVAMIFNIVKYHLLIFEIQIKIIK